MNKSILPKAPSDDLGEWSTIITPHRGWLEVRWRELWQYRDLIYLFVRRDFVGTYKQTVLGPIWFFLQPIFTTIVFTVVFGKIAKISTDALPPPLFYLSGIVMWQYFADCLNKTSSTFTSNAGIFGKVYFPRLVVPISTVITSLITFAIQFVLFLSLLAFFKIQGAPVYPNYRIIILPFLLLMMASLGLGVGCLVSSLTTRYRDLAVAVGFGVQLWMYASAVVYPLSEIPAEWRWLLVLNPMVPIIESFRFAFLGLGVVEIWQIAMGAGVCLLVLLGGILTFNHVEKTFSDTV
jgi:lipopolysaccharide transport system permease protein